MCLFVFLHQKWVLHQPALKGKAGIQGECDADFWPVWAVSKGQRSGDYVVDPDDHKKAAVSVMKENS